MSSVKRFEVGCSSSSGGGGRTVDYIPMTTSGGETAAAAATAAAAQEGGKKETLCRSEDAFSFSSFPASRGTGLNRRIMRPL